MTARVLLALVAASATLLAGCGGDERATAKVPESFFGVAPQDPLNSADFARMKNGGVGSYHLLLSWSRVERSPGAYEWSSYDQLLTELALRGIEPVPYVFGTPRHFADKGIVPPTKSPQALAAWEGFLRAAAERYGPGGAFWDLFAESNPGVEPVPLTTWEIWNEVNAPAFWHPKPSPRAYAKLLKRSRKALRSVDPGAEIMVAGMFATPSSPKAIVSFDFLRRLYRKPGMRRVIDLVAIHPYGPRLGDVKRQMSKTAKVMRKAGEGDAGMWVTELGWGSEKEQRSKLTTSRRKQAKLLRGAYRMLIDKRKRWNVRGALWYTWRDPSRQVQECRWCQSAGLFDRDLDPKPAWVQFTRLTGGDA